MPFSFLNAAFLVGMAAAALPILIHLFSRRKVARMPFSSLKFLEEIARRRVRRMRLTQWIILALRVLALALLALALGRPAFRGDFAFGKSRGESAVAVVLDRSFSMRAEGERETLWEKAKNRAQEAMEALEPNDTVYLVEVDPAVEQVETFPGSLGASEMLRTLEAGYGSTDMAAAVRRAAAALADATALNKELFIISDFQRAGLGSGTETGATDFSADLDPDVRVFLLPVGEGPMPNTALEEARLEGNTVDQRVVVRAGRHAPTPAEDLAVTVEAGNEVLGEAVVTVLGGGTESAEVSLSRPPGEGETVLARLSRDRLAVDDVRYIPASGAGGVEAWIVQDPAQPSPFVPLALNPHSDGGRFRVRRVGPEALGAADLAEVQLIVLDNVSYVSREALMRLRQWRSAGGNVFIVLGDRVDLRYYNDSLLPALFSGLALGNLLGTDEATGTSYSLTPRAPGHEAFFGFDAKVGQPLTGASFWRVVEVKNPAGVRTLAEFGPGLPALVQGEGALLFASSLDGRWSNFTTHAAFVPLVHQSLDAMMKEGSRDRVTVGDPIQTVADRARVPAGAELVCEGPNGLRLKVTAEAAPRGVRLVSAPAPAPGLYTLRAGDRVLARRVVNLDTAESDLKPLTSDELRALFPGERVTIIENSASLGTPVREARYGREFWRELVVIVLLLMLVEGWLSRRGVA